MRAKTVQINPTTNFVLAAMPMAFFLHCIFTFALNICWTEIYVGPIVAAYIVSTNYFFVPSKRIQVSFTSLCAGSALTFIFVQSYYPECHIFAYKPTRVAQFSTIISGVFTFAMVSSFHTYKNWKLNKSLKDAP